MQRLEISKVIQIQTCMSKPVKSLQIIRKATNTTITSRYNHRCNLSQLTTMTVLINSSCSSKKASRTSHLNINLRGRAVDLKCPRKIHRLKTLRNRKLKDRRRRNQLKRHRYLNNSNTH